MNEPPPPRRPEHSCEGRRRGPFIAVLYSIGMSLRGNVFPGIVGGILAGILCYLVLREIEQRRDRRGR